MKPVKIVPLTRAIPPTHKDHQQEQWQQVIAHHYPKELTNENTNTHDSATESNRK